MAIVFGMRRCLGVFDTIRGPACLVGESDGLSHVCARHGRASNRYPKIQAISSSIREGGLHHFISTAFISGPSHSPNALMKINFVQRIAFARSRNSKKKSHGRQVTSPTIPCANAFHIHRYPCMPIYVTNATRSKKKHDVRHDKRSPYPKKPATVL